MSLEHRSLRQSLSAAGRGLDQAQRDLKHAIVRTSDGVEIRGMIHIPPGTRTLDFMNRPSESFIAVTQATLVVSGRVEQAEFLAVNKAHITVLRELSNAE
ncbi:MAG TPA: hypothetical protein VII06_27880 [Chloroflexota bacterium]|jgi:hypothetical protein